MCLSVLFLGRVLVRKLNFYFSFQIPFGKVEVQDTSTMSTHCLTNDCTCTLIKSDSLAKRKLKLLCLM